MRTFSNDYCSGSPRGGGGNRKKFSGYFSLFLKIKSTFLLFFFDRVKICLHGGMCGGCVSVSSDAEYSFLVKGEKEKTAFFQVGTVVQM